MEDIRIFAFGKVRDSYHWLIKTLIKKNESIVRKNFAKYIDLFWQKMLRHNEIIFCYCGLLDIQMITDCFIENPIIIKYHIRYIYDNMNNYYYIEKYIQNDIIKNIIKNNYQLFKDDLTEYIKYMREFEKKYNVYAPPNGNLSKICEDILNQP